MKASLSAFLSYNKQKIKQAVRPVVGPPQYAPAPCKW